MDPFHIALLVAAGIAGGIIATIVGGAAVVTYPALIASGVSPQLAAICNLTALMPGTMLGALSDHTQLPPFNRAFFGLILTSIIGAGIGASLLLLTPERVFAVFVPVLLGFATVLFAYAERISLWLRARAADRGHELSFNLSSLKMLLPVSFYGGYFGAGLGILVLGIFTVATGGHYRSANATKNLVTGLNGFAASVVFISQGAVVWPQTLALMAGTVVGGLIGARVARVIPRKVVRVLIVAAGVALTVEFARRYWF